ncbi:MAG TPA: PQQ-dependent sugar dehydrogenase [Aeromicrobium sp.]|nr:PQQ-dependent sugar dehydrogenase [Aeromicrobium sp.]
MHDDGVTDRRTFLTGLAGAGALALVGCGPDGDRSAPTAPGPATPTRTRPVRPRVTGTIASGLNVPWGIAFLPDGRAFVSQRDAGVLTLVDPEGRGADRVRELGTIPGSIGESGASRGLLGLALDPDDDTGLFACFTTARDERIVRIDVTGDRLGDIEPILTNIPVGKGHFGGRLAFGPDGLLYASTGEMQLGAPAQDKKSLAGKILRITKEGKPANGNPFDNEVWSWGHRNVEGIAFDGEGRLWASEFGDKKADELNLITKGGNYGWPTAEGESAEARFVAPKATWPVADCSPSGIAIAQSTAFVAALRGTRLWAVPLHGTRVGKPRDYFIGEYGRLRSVQSAPDGSLWLTTSNTDGNGKAASADDRILRVVLD